jgi:parallel beta-helix repeat protein
MKKHMLMLALWIIAANLAWADCIEPQASMEIEDAVFCSGTYNAGSISVKSNATIDCNNATLLGTSVGYGFLISGKSNVEIRNCNIENFEVGIYVKDSKNTIVANTVLRNNKFGIGLLNSEGSIFANNTFENNIEDIFAYEAKKPAAEEKQAAAEEAPSREEILIEALKLKKPGLSEKEIKLEVGSLLEKYLPITQQNLIIKRNFRYNAKENTTTVLLSILPKKTLHNLSLYEHIPKCFSEYLAEISFVDKNFEVISEEPLIMWSFDALAEEKTLSYSVRKEISEECKKLFRAFGIATQFGDAETKAAPIGAFISLLVTLLIIVGVICLKAIKD